MELGQLEAIDHWAKIYAKEALRKKCLENDERIVIVKWWTMEQYVKGYEAA